jgi:hypothetical protein
MQRKRERPASLDVEPDSPIARVYGMHHRDWSATARDTAWRIHEVA